MLILIFGHLFTRKRIFQELTYFLYSSKTCFPSLKTLLSPHQRIPGHRNKILKCQTLFFCVVSLLNISKCRRSSQTDSTRANTTKIYITIMVMHLPLPNTCKLLIKFSFRSILLINRKTCLSRQICQVFFILLGSSYFLFSILQPQAVNIKHRSLQTNINILSNNTSYSDIVQLRQQSS